jgi:hypothetical protein
MYCEDVDLCWRVNHTPCADGAFWRVAYYPDSVIYHLIGKSSDKVPTRMTYEFHRSQYLFYKKHYHATTPWLVRPLIPVGIGLRATGQMIRYRLRYWRKRITGEQPPPKRLQKRKKPPKDSGGKP